MDGRPNKYHMNASLLASRKFPAGIELFRFLGLTAGFSLAAWLSFQLGLKTALAVPLILAVLALGFLDYPKFLLLAVLVRSSLDTFTGSTLSLGPLSLNPAGLLGLLLVFFTPFHCVNKEKIFGFPVAKGFALFLLLSTPAIFAAFRHFGPEGAIALKEAIRLSSLFSLIISLLIFFKTPTEMRKLFYTAFISLAVPLTVGFYQAVTGTGNTVSTDGQNRIFGTLFHPNTFSLYLVVFIAVVLSWNRSTPSMGKKFLLALLLSAQFLTFSMGALAATGLVFVVHFWQSRKNRIGLVLLLLLLPALGSFSENWRHRFSQLTQMELAEELHAREISNSMSWRVLHWYVLLQYAKEHPVTGWGLLTTEKITPWKTEEGQGFAAHNDAVRLFLETGIIGLAGYCIFLFFTGRWIFRGSKTVYESSDTGLSNALKAVFATMFLLSFAAEEPLVHTAFLYYFFTFLVLAKNGFSFRYLQPEEKR